METTCGSLMFELQKIWDEIGKPVVKKDKMLVELEQECLGVYRRKVDQARMSRAQLQQAIADSEAELADICSAMGERPVHVRQFDQKASGNLKEELKTIIPQLEEMRKRKIDRRNQFVEILNQLQDISIEICRSAEDNQFNVVVDETDLSLKRLEQLHRQLLELQNEKSNRLKHVLDHLNTLNSLCVVLGMDFKRTSSEIHPTLDDSKGTKNIGNETIERLASAIQSLREVKIQRMQQLQDLATTLLELWNLMDTAIEEQQMFQNVTSNIAASEHEITEPDILSLNFIGYVKAEVSRLEQLKSGKMKELVLKKKLELEDICRRTHMVLDVHSAMEYSIEAIESGAMDTACLLEQIEHQIAKVKEEAIIRKEILEKVEKWLAVCEEECWLEEYNRDDSRYNAGRGAHLTLKRAEKARAVVNKIPAMVEALNLKAIAWEKERGVEFSYDGVRLLAMLEQYSILRQEKEQERQRQRDQKKLQEQLIAEQESLFGSKPSPSKSGKKFPRTSMGGACYRRFSLGGAMLQSSKPEKAARHSRLIKKGDSANQNNSNHQRSAGFAGLSTEICAGKKNLHIAGNSVKKHSSTTANAHESESPLVRKPFSPVSSMVSSKANIANYLEDQNRTHNGTLQVTLSSSKKPMATPPKSVSHDEENKTPKTMPIPAPTTPLTVSVPMQTATTPAAFCVPFGAKIVQETAEENEYSFEERRAQVISKVSFAGLTY
ncbi:hypothetical protein L1049_018311 [Liquidambar formosana]|uniref:Uncharacterized protein n=1 Tax=Liquidambar formosana TaxID=63359 RepID=A0AAP0R9W4_LIQFO